MGLPITLGLHFGHDSSVAVVKDGEVRACLEIERKTRIRHAIGLTWADVDETLNLAGISLSEINSCSVTSTQGVEYLFPDPDLLSFMVVNPTTYKGSSERRLASLSETFPEHEYMKRLVPALQTSLTKMPYVPSMEDFGLVAGWQVPVSLGELGQVLVPSISPVTQSQEIEINLKGRKVPGLLLGHHLAHAAYGYYSSPYDEAIIISHDGSLPGNAYQGGGIYMGASWELSFLAPHWLDIANLYERVAALIGLGFAAGPGKLMGLAPYGKKSIFDVSFVENASHKPATTAVEFFPDWLNHPNRARLNAWLLHLADLGGFGFEGLRKIFLGSLSPLDDVATFMAANTQELFQRTMWKATQSVTAAIGSSSKNIPLVISGGAALNCPANSLISVNMPDPACVFIPPAVHDGGLSMGSALYANHLLRRFRKSARSMSLARHAYLGRPLSKGDDSQLFEKDTQFVRIVGDTPWLVAQAIEAGEIIAVAQGRSEIGPRALGNRSILASPKIRNNWVTVNEVKGREVWRPFAPVVLEEDFERYFDTAAGRSPFMLKTVTVKSDLLPAITHVDGTARVQTLTRGENEWLEAVLDNPGYISGVKVLLNTSLNGPGEPIADNERDVHDMAANSKIALWQVNDALYARKGLWSYSRN